MEKDPSYITEDAAPSAAVIDAVELANDTRDQHWQRTIASAVAHVAELERAGRNLE